MDLAPDIRALLDALLDGIREALGENFVGLYLRGSLAYGDATPATSDVDALAVTEAPVTGLELAALAALHRRVAASPSPYARRLEIAYVDRAALRRFTPGQRHPTLGQGEELVLSEHRDNWIFERWTLRERGVTLAGPPPDTLIDPIAPEELRAATRRRLRDWADWAAQPDDPDFLLPRSHKAYVVETMCRALLCVARAEVTSKPRAVAWALENLPAPWPALVRRSRAWRTDPTVDPAILGEVLAFVRWAAADGAALLAGEG